MWGRKRKDADAERPSEQPPQRLRDALRKVKSGEVVTLQVLRRTPDTADGWAGTVVRLRAR